MPQGHAKEGGTQNDLAVHRVPLAFPVPAQLQIGNGISIRPHVTKSFLQEQHLPNLPSKRQFVIQICRH